MKRRQANKIIKLLTNGDYCWRYPTLRRAALRLGHGAEVDKFLATTIMVARLLLHLDRLAAAFNGVAGAVESTTTKLERFKHCMGDVIGFHEYQEETDEALSA